jgi:zinc/manganese transport system substrate-binding protein
MLNNVAMNKSVKLITLLMAVIGAILIGMMFFVSDVKGAEPRLRVSSLNPILSDIARQVGGGDVAVIDLMPKGQNPHSYYPSPEDLKKASRSALVLAAGKGLEPYLGEMRESLGDVKIYELGSAVPSLHVEEDHGLLCVFHHHDDHIVDPHWWHSVRNVRWAAKALSEVFAKIDVDHAKNYRARYNEYAERLRDLDRWVRQRIGTIPRGDRELATSHNAFGYLCRDYGLRAIAIQGLSPDIDPDPDYLKEVIQVLKENQVRAVFTEDSVNPKVMASMVRETGVRVGGSLFAGTLPTSDPTIEGMMRHNVATIVDSVVGER